LASSRSWDLLELGSFKSLDLLRARHLLRAGHLLRAEHLLGAGHLLFKAGCLLLQMGSTSKLYQPPEAKFIVTDWGDIVDYGIGLTLSPPIRDNECGFCPLFNFEVTNGFTTPSYIDTQEPDHSV
jgi:hypothetical protein